MSLAKIEEIYAIRLHLDPLAAKLACQRMTTAEIREVQNKLPPESGPSNLDLLAYNREFHRSIYSASGNSSLTRVLESLWDQCDRFRVGILGDPATSAQARCEHSQMCDLLIERDADGLAEVMQLHLKGSLENSRRALLGQEDGALHPGVMLPGTDARLSAGVPQSRATVP